MAGVEDLVNLGNLIGQVRGQKQTTTQRGGTTRETTRTDVSEEGINELIRGILSGPGGVQDVGGAARSAGVFDSTTEDLLLGNLYARAAAQGELARSPTIRETETPDVVTTTEVPGIGIGPLAGTLAATSLAAPLVKGASGALAEGGGIQGVVSSLFGGGGGGAGQAATATGARAGADFLSRTLTGGTAQAGASAAGSAAGSAIPGGFMSEVATGGIPGGAGGVANAATSFLGGLQGQKLSPVDVGASIATGFMMGGPPGAAIAAIGSVLGNLGGKTLAGTVICTALTERGLLDREQYKAGLQYLYEMSDATRDGYHYWAIGIADKIRAGSKFWTAVCLPFAKGRTALLASQGSIGDHFRHPVGTLTKFVGEPICWTIGKMLAARERIYG